MANKAPILGWCIDRGDRLALLEQVPPRYARKIADHITHGREDAAPPLPQVRCATVIGRADDGLGVEALVVELAGESDRWDGSTYHVTWSLAQEREAKESNDVIARNGWQPIDARPIVRLTPATWP